MHRYELNVLDHIALSSLPLFRRDYDFNDCARLMMIPFVSDIPNLPSEVLKEYRKYGLSDEEILESFSDAIDFFNSRFWCEELQGCIALDCIFH